MKYTDEDILDAIFNKADGIVLPTLDPNDERHQSIDHSLLMRLQQLELDAVGMAEDNKLDAALELLTTAIRLEPTYASAYNNRAQVHRLMGNDDAAYSDLDKAIEYGEGLNGILNRAFTQRALISKSRGDADKAQQDLIMAARYGSHIAKAIVKGNNPYSKMCNAVVAEAMARLTNE